MFGGEVLTEIGGHEVSIELDVLSDEEIKIDNISVNLDGEWIDLEDFIERYKYAEGLK